MFYILIITAVIRILILIPMIMFFHDQSAKRLKNGDVARVRVATLVLDLALIIMFGNLAYVNVKTAFGNPSMVDPWLACVSLLASGATLWAMTHLWNLFKRIDRAHKK